MLTPLRPSCTNSQTSTSNFNHDYNFTKRKLPVGIKRFGLATHSHSVNNKNQNCMSWLRFLFVKFCQNFRSFASRELRMKIKIHSTIVEGDTRWTNKQLGNLKQSHKIYFLLNFRKKVTKFWKNSILKVMWKATKT